MDCCIHILPCNVNGLHYLCIHGVWNSRQDDVGKRSRILAGTKGSSTLLGDELHSLFNILVSRGDFESKQSITKTINNGGFDNYQLCQEESHTSRWGSQDHSVQSVCPSLPLVFLSFSTPTSTLLGKFPRLVGITTRPQSGQIDGRYLLVQSIWPFDGSINPTISLTIKLVYLFNDSETFSVPTNSFQSELDLLKQIWKFEKGWKKGMNDCCNRSIKRSSWTFWS